MVVASEFCLGAPAGGGTAILFSSADNVQSLQDVCAGRGCISPATQGALAAFCPGRTRSARPLPSLGPTPAWPVQGQLVAGPRLPAGAIDCTTSARPRSVLGWSAFHRQRASCSAAVENALGHGGAFAKGRAQKARKGLGRARVSLTFRRGGAVTASTLSSVRMGISVQQLQERRGSCPSPSSWRAGAQFPTPRPVPALQPPPQRTRRGVRGLVALRGAAGKLSVPTFPLASSTPAPPHTHWFIHAPACSPHNSITYPPFSASPTTVCSLIYTRWQDHDQIRLGHRCPPWPQCPRLMDKKSGNTELQWEPSAPYGAPAVSVTV